jgi:MarR family transcriptional regulator, organic hydroperoxide resistance regulator
VSTAVESESFALGPDLDFMRSLWRLNHAFERLSRRMVANFGVTGQQRMIIRCVGKYPGMTATQLARHFHLDAGTVSTALARLERRGLVERRRAARDRRRLTLGLTAAGRSVDRVAGTSERAFERLLNAVNAGDIARSAQVLDVFSELLDREVPEGSAAASVPAVAGKRQRQKTRTGETRGARNPNRSH